jgi:membrane protein
MIRATALMPTLKRAVVGFVDDDVLTLAAALAFYTTLSFAPMLVLGLWLVSSAGPDARVAILSEIGALAGGDAQAAAAVVIHNAHARPAIGSIAGIAGIVVLLIGASSVFAQLQYSLNIIWRVQALETASWWTWARRRVVSAGLLGATLFVLAASLVISSVLGFALPRSGYLWDLANQIVSLAVITALFAALFRYLPDIRLRWSEAGTGAFATAALFGVGKLLIGQYLVHSDVGGPYGSVGSVVLFLVWVYYSATIFLFGAELIKANITSSAMIGEPL